MKILLTVVADIRQCHPNGNMEKKPTTWWTRELEIPERGDVEHIIARAVIDITSNYPRRNVEDRPIVMSISHCIIP